MKYLLARCLFLFLLSVTVGAPASAQTQRAGKKTPAPSQKASKSPATGTAPKSDATPKSDAATKSETVKQGEAAEKSADKAAEKKAAEKSPGATSSQSQKSAPSQGGAASKSDAPKKADAAKTDAPAKAAAKNQPGAAGKRKAASAAKAAGVGDAALKVKLDEAAKLPASQRVRELERLLKANPQSSLRTRAAEMLTAARAALGDERLLAGDAAGGVELFRLAVAEAPSEMSDKLFAEVVSQLPANLFLRGQRDAAFELARRVEERAAQNPKRLLMLAAFYLSVEQPDDAARLAQTASRLAPDMSSAYQALGAAQRIALRLDEARASFQRAVELDPKSTNARRALADLQRASGRSDEALALYRELLASEARDSGARTGLVLSLFDAGKREEAERELAAALKDEPQNLSLLVGAAWWYVAHGEAARGEELATEAVRLEPRYTWAHIALARSLVAQRRPLEAERSLRFARRYGRFPTLDYELASTLAAAGLYDEAAEELSNTFTLKDGQLETQLAGRTPAHAGDFTELLAPERRASIFQPASADTEANARMLKNLLALHLRLQAQSAASTSATSATDTDAGATEASAFAEGDDEMRAFRQLYAAARLLRGGVAPAEVVRLTEAAMGRVDAALSTPVASVALFAEELREARARANDAGASTNVPDLPRNVLSNVMRGRIEDLTGWALFGSGKPQEAVVHLRRATSVLPEQSPMWRGAMWHLGAALDASGNQPEALAAYLKSYNRQSPDAARRAIIESLYRRVNGSTDGLDEKIGPAPVAISVASNSTPDEAATTTTTTTATTPAPTTTTAATPTPATATTPAPTTVDTTSTPETSQPATTSTPDTAPTTTSTAPTTTSTAPTPTPSPSMTSAPDASATPATTTPTPATTPKTSAPTTSTNDAPTTSTPTTTPASTPTTTATPASNTTTSTPAPTPTPDAAASATTTPAPTPTPEATPAAATAQPTPTPEATPAPETTRATPPSATTEGSGSSSGGNSSSGGECALLVSEGELTLNRGGAAALVVSFSNPGSATKIEASTPNWSDIVVLAEPRREGEPASTTRFTISSVSQKTGAYVVTFTSPCGTRKVTVTVK